MHNAGNAGKWTTTFAGLALSLGLAGSALAQSKGLDEPFREGYKKALAGKTVPTFRWPWALTWLRAGTKA